MNNNKVVTLPGVEGHPKPLMQMKITLLDNKSVIVNGIPSNLRTALSLLFDANKAVVDHFVGQAKDGNLDEVNTIVQKNIISPINKILI